MYADYFSLWTDTILLVTCFGTAPWRQTPNWKSSWIMLNPCEKKQLEKCRTESLYGCIETRSKGFGIQANAGTQVSECEQSGEWCVQPTEGSFSTMTCKLLNASSCFSTAVTTSLTFGMRLLGNFLHLQEASGSWFKPKPNIWFMTSQPQKEWN